MVIKDFEYAIKINKRIFITFLILCTTIKAHSGFKINQLLSHEPKIFKNIHNKSVLFFKNFDFFFFKWEI